MLIEIFGILFVLCVTLIFLGYYSDIESLKIGSFTILFLLGVVLMVSGVDYVAGIDTNTTYQYGNNFTGYHWDYDTGTAPTLTPSDDPSFLFHTMKYESPNYVNYTNHTIGFILAVIGALGFLEVFFQYGNRRRREY